MHLEAASMNTHPGLAELLADLGTGEVDSAVRRSLLAAPF
jgi:hypothetical protein